MGTLAHADHCRYQRPYFGWGVEITLVCDIRLAAVEATLVFRNAAWVSSRGPAAWSGFKGLCRQARRKNWFHEQANRWQGGRAHRLGEQSMSADVLMVEATSMAERTQRQWPIGSS